MNNLEQLKKDLEMWAKMAPEYQREVRNVEVITLFANKYCTACDENDDHNRNVYLSALMLKFWDQVYKIYTKVKTAGKDIEDAVNILWECINIACQPKYRIWQKRDDVNAQQAINQTIATRGVAQVMYESNLKKNKDRVNLLSLDDYLDEDGECTYGDLLADSSSDIESNSQGYDLIQECIANNHIVEAIIMDNMATKDVFKHESHIESEIDEVTGETRKYTKTSSTFWPYKLVKELNELDESYVKYFLSTYKVQLEQFQAAFTAISKANNQKKYKYISQTQAYGRQLIAAD